MKRVSTFLAKGFPVALEGSRVPFDNPFSAEDLSRQRRLILGSLQKSDLYATYRDAFQGATCLPLALRPVGSFRSPLADARNGNPFCRLLASDSKSCAACLLRQQQFEGSAIGEARTLDCFAGISESVVPVHLGEHVVAFLQTGQVLLHPPSERRFRICAGQLRELGAVFDEGPLRKAYFATRIIPRRQYDCIMRLLIVFAEHLSSLTNQIVLQSSGAELPVVALARTFIQDHHTEELSLTAVARAVHMSPFYFCKIFRRETGLTFTDYVARMRVESVKIQLLVPHRNIGEAAFACGFQSLSQFNRVFRRHAGQAPSTFRMQ
jgi:AraC-like DNA-binding protein/ligand-binding sensor protein